jgi:hypothetical protein
LVFHLNSSGSKKGGFQGQVDASAATARSITVPSRAASHAPFVGMRRLQTINQLLPFGQLVDQIRAFKEPIHA